MVVISGIKTAIKIAPIIYKIGKITYKGFKSTRKGQQWLSRHPKALKYGTAAAGVGSLLLDLTTIDYDALLPKTVSTPKNGQTRKYMEFPGSRSRYQYSNRPYCVRRPIRRQKQSYRMRSW